MTSAGAASRGGSPAAQGEQRDSHGADAPGNPRGSPRATPPKGAPLNIAPIESHLPKGACRLLTTCYGVKPGTRLCDLAPRPLQVARDMTRTLSRRGAQLRKGVFVRAVDPLHLGTVCQGVAESPPRDRDTAWPLVLKRLQESWTDTLAEREKRSAVRDAAERRAQLELARTWADEHPDEWGPRETVVRRDFAAQYRGDADSAMGQAFLAPVLEAALVAAYQEYLAGGDDVQDGDEEASRRVAGSGA